MTRLKTLIALLTLALLPNALHAQNPKPDATIVKTFYLPNTSQLEASEVLVTLRNMVDPTVKIFLVGSQNAIVVKTTPDQIEIIQHILADLDHARNSRTYRLTYTLADFDNGKRVGTQHYAMLVVNGQRTTMKQGDKVPILTGTPSNTAESQVQYLDIGMNFDATLDEFSSGVRLRSKIEQSSVAERNGLTAANDPIVRQTVLEGTSFLTPGKPLTLGSLDITGTTRHLEISVVMELVP
jgi:type II secretory pathway component GspD/PulD (secretin)